MKTSKLIFPGIFAVLIFFTACQRNASELTPPPSPNGSSTTVLTAEAATCNPNAYNIVLESTTLVNGNWEWVWSVHNPNPGNGNGGTSQDLSHWGMQFGSCFNWSAVVGAAYSNNGSSWTSFTPSYSTDPSQSCLTTPVLKYDYGTSGGAKSYYRLTLNQAHEVASSLGYYKSGSRTKCCTFNFIGIGCASGDDGGPR